MTCRATGQRGGTYRGPYVYQPSQELIPVTSLDLSEPIELGLNKKIIQPLL